MRKVTNNITNAYVYAHTRLDTNDVFYIGIGNIANHKRAYQKIKRSDFWKNVTNKTEYSVEIIADGLSWEEAIKMECELIALYGRQDNGTGILVNMTDGGDGNLNPSKIIRDKISKSLIGLKQSDETKAKRSASAKKTWQCPILRQLKREQTTKLVKEGVLSRKGIPSKKKGIKLSKELCLKTSIGLKEYYKTNKPSNYITLPQEKIDLILKDYDSKLSIEQIKIKHNICKTVLYRIVKDNNAKPKSNPTSKEEFEELYKTYSQPELAKKLDCSVANIQRMVRKYKIYKYKKYESIK